MAHLTRHTDAHPLSLGPPGAYHVHTDTQPPLRPKTWMPVAREEKLSDLHTTNITLSASPPLFSCGCGVDVAWVLRVEGAQ